MRILQTEVSLRERVFRALGMLTLDILIGLSELFLTLAHLCISAHGKVYDTMIYEMESAAEDG